MKIKSRALGSVLAALPVAIALALGTGPVFANGLAVPMVSVDHQHNSWFDPDSGGWLSISAAAFEGCGTDPFAMTWRYHVFNSSYNPWGPGPCWEESGCSNGLSGFQIVFDQAIPELHNQQSPAVGGPWDQNAFSGQAPPWGVEWDVDFDDWDESGAPVYLGIMPGGNPAWGQFSFCTDERVSLRVWDEGIGAGPYGWAHSWGMLPWWDDSTQINIFHGANMIPGDLYTDLGLACSESDIICKKVKFLDENGNSRVEVGELVVFRSVIHVDIPGCAWTDAKLKDNFGGQLDVEIVGESWLAASAPQLKFRGKTEKASLSWDIGDACGSPPFVDCAEGDMHTVVLDATTDINPGGNQSYSECGLYEFNSGAVLKFRDSDGKKHSYGTGSVDVPVYTEGMQGDCDGDEYPDWWEVKNGFDPFDPEDPGTPG